MSEWTCGSSRLEHRSDRGRASSHRAPAGISATSVPLALLLALLSTAPRPARAACDSSIFRDGFQSGDTSRWSSSPAAPQATGTWTFALDFDGTARTFSLELRQRADGSLVGYLLGGTQFRTMVSGGVTGSAVSFTLELRDPATTRTITLAGTLSRTGMTLTASGDIATQSVAAGRLECDLSEQQLVAAETTGGTGPLHLRDLSVVLDEEGQLVAGGFVGEEDCDLWACDGGVTSFSDDGTVLTVGLETDGGCSAGSSFSATWDAGSGLYSGSYTFHDCTGTATGDLLAAYGMGTSSAAARDALAGRASIADLLEADIPISEPLAALAPGYLDFGKDEPALRGELNAEISAYDDIEVELSRPRELVTVTHPRTLPDFVRPMGWTVDERRSGVPVAGGPGSATYRDTATRPIIDDFARLGLDAGRWKIVGNQVPAIDLPFAYTIPVGGSRLEAPTADGDPVYVALGPYGTHFQPLTGDPSGEGKANFVGFLPRDDSEMEELVDADGPLDGVREPGDVWGYPAGGDLSGDRVRDRRPVYRPPVDGEVTALIYDHGPTGVYFDDEPQWRIELTLLGELRMALGHIGKIAPALRALVLTETGTDPDSFTGPNGTDLLAGHAPIAVAAGSELAFPQILADPVPGHPGYYVGGGSFLDYPWAQIEFQVPHHLGSSHGPGGDFCVYRFLSATRRAELQTTMENDMLDPASQRYRATPFSRRWQWTAQSGLCQAENPLPDDFSSLYTRLGGWYERTEPGTTADELFSFIPIDKSTGVYDTANYDSPDVAHLVLRSLWPSGYSWTMPDATNAVTFLPTGEVLTLDASSMLVKWRELNGSNPIVYQRLAYLLDASGLKIRWGNFAATPAGAVQPTLLPGDACNDTDVLCYDHSLGAWPP